MRAPPVFALPTDTPCVAIRYALHELAGTEPIPGAPGAFFPTPAAFRALAAANAVVAEDVTDPARRVCLPGPNAELLPGGIAAAVFVTLDLDANPELVWLKVAVDAAARLKAAGTLPPADRDTPGPEKRG